VTYYFDAAKIQKLSENTKSRINNKTKEKKKKQK